jgi:DNA-binding winged helix-turn-helix (wHTH) protein
VVDFSRQKGRVVGIAQNSDVLRFGVFEVDFQAGELRKAGLRIKLQEQPFQVLAMLLERRGGVVTREELHQRLWPGDNFGDFDHGLNTAVKKLRQALGDESDNPRFIETLPRRGYRLIAAIAPVNPQDRRLAESPTTVAVQDAPAVPAVTFWKIAVPVLAVALFVAGGLYYRLRHQSRSLTEKDTIVLADFANSTSDPIFDATLKTALNISLRQSPFLNVLSDGQVAETLQQMTRAAGAKLTPEIARELCQRVGSKAYLVGSISNLGTEYVVGLKAIDCQDGDMLAQQQMTAASKEKVLDALGEAAFKLRGELGESAGSLRKFDASLEQATTFSLEALKSYSLGRKAYSAQGSGSALPYDERTIQIDPNFAMGYWALGTDYWGLGEVGRASEYYAKAFHLREHTK